MFMSISFTKNLNSIGSQRMQTIAHSGLKINKDKFKHIFDKEENN